jgi:hypothetical protein
MTNSSPPAGNVRAIDLIAGRKHLPSHFALRREELSRLLIPSEQVAEMVRALVADGSWSPRKIDGEHYEPWPAAAVAALLYPIGTREAAEVAHDLGLLANQKNERPLGPQARAILRRNLQIFRELHQEKLEKARRARQMDWGVGRARPSIPRER